jgi:hypothetical protein
MVCCSVRSNAPRELPADEARGGDGTPQRGGSRPGAHAAIAASPTSLRRANMFTARARVRNTLDLTPQRETMRHLSTARRFRRVPCPVSNCLCTRAHCIQGSRRTLQARVPPTPRRPTLRPSSPRSRLVAQMEAPSNCSSPTGGACGTAMGRTFSRRRGEAEARRPGHGQRIHLRISDLCHEDPGTRNSNFWRRWSQR